MHDDVVGGFIARHGADMLSALLVDRATGRNIIWAYVESLRLEITCGEAPFICSRYDTVTGEPIPIRDRIGFLDRKLRVITERTKRNADWMAWAFKALTATYGYEYQREPLADGRAHERRAHGCGRDDHAFRAHHIRGQGTADPFQHGGNIATAADPQLSPMPHL